MFIQFLSDESGGLELSLRGLGIFTPTMAQNLCLEIIKCEVT